MFELTGALTYGTVPLFTEPFFNLLVLPIMFTVMVAKWVGEAIMGGGIYDRLIEYNKYPFLYYHQESDYGMTASEICTAFDDLAVIFAKEANLTKLGECFLIFR